ncbi:alpha/beta hydrolase [Microbacterium schleiferi]|uniref:Alpha/beta hydrolase n=1 Tax=Microbacterium schleiferi TaxID=69362 RepID=A0ABU7V8I0_9MICO
MASRSGLRSRGSAARASSSSPARARSGETTTVLYDRAGTGWSGAVRLPRPVEQVTAELVRLLEALDVSPPFILVGHSLGGAYAQRVAMDLGRDVTGVVLLDPVHRDWNRAMPPELRIESGASARYTVDDIDVPAARAALFAMLKDLDPDVRDAILDVRMRDDRLLTGMHEVANFAEMLEDLPPALPGTAVRAIHATAVDPMQAHYRSAELLQTQIDAMRDMYIAAFGAEAYRPAPEANHSTLPFAAHDQIVEAVRESLR